MAAPALQPHSIAMWPERGAVLYAVEQHETLRSPTTDPRAGREWRRVKCPRLERSKTTVSPPIQETACGVLLFEVVT
jgi:hypothetical protein